MVVRILLVVIITVNAVMASTTRQEETDCQSEGCNENSASNKFALLFQQMLTRQREINTDCQLIVDCAEGSECIDGKCRNVGPKRTKIINLYSRW